MIGTPSSWQHLHTPQASLRHPLCMLYGPQYTKTWEELASWSARTWWLRLTCLCPRQNKTQEASSDDTQSPFKWNVRGVAVDLVAVSTKPILQDQGLLLDDLIPLPKVPNQHLILVDKLFGPGLFFPGLLFKMITLTCHQWDWTKSQNPWRHTLCLSPTASSSQPPYVSSL